MLKWSSNPSSLGAFPTIVRMNVFDNVVDVEPAALGLLVGVARVGVADGGIVSGVGEAVPLPSAAVFVPAPQAGIENAAKTRGRSRYPSRAAIPRAAVPP